MKEIQHLPYHKRVHPTDDGQVLTTICNKLVEVIDQINSHEYDIRDLKHWMIDMKDKLNAIEKELRYAKSKN